MLWPLLLTLTDNSMQLTTLKPILLILCLSCAQAPLDSVDEMRYFARDRNAANQIDVYAERYTAAKDRAALYRNEATKLETELGRIRGEIQAARDLNSQSSKDLIALNAANAKLTADIAAAKAKQAALTAAAAAAAKPAAAPVVKPATKAVAPVKK